MMNNSENIIEVRDLQKKFGSIVAVDGISFDVKRGSCTGLLGPNGAGKTSTVKILECISPMDGGSASILGIPAGLSSRRVREQIGVIPQDNDLDPDLSIWQNLWLFTKFFDIPSHIAHERIEEQLKFMELYDRRHGRIEELSGGMKRRVLIARSLINDPKLLILDEPTTGLDPQMRHAIWQRIRSLKEQNLSMVLTTHYMEEAEQLCDEVMIIHKGRIIERGKPKNLIAEMIGPEVIEIREHGGLSNVKKILEGVPLTIEEFGDTIYIQNFHTDEVLKRLTACCERSVMRRRGTLEDVFLKLTGRALND